MRMMAGTALLGLTLARREHAVAARTTPSPGSRRRGPSREALTKLGDGRDVELVLKNGKSYRGKLGTVGTATVLVTNLVGKEFYDVLIDLDEVAAVELRTR